MGSIWNKSDHLSNTKVNMSFKEWLAIDKQVGRGPYDGIRYLHGKVFDNTEKVPHGLATVGHQELL